VVQNSFRSVESSYSQFFGCTSLSVQQKIRFCTGNQEGLYCFDTA
jgi:hypothetical protein